VRAGGKGGGELVVAVAGNGGFGAVAEGTGCGDGGWEGGEAGWVE
jgi:hypothetical protein